ncbi:MAG: hypothetical protein ABSE56_15965 [Bryobacteraceae bacterium]|jgi:hypothetical protein
MTIPIKVKRGRPEPRLERFQEVLLAARHTEYYAPRLEAAGLATPWEVGSLREIEDGLARLPAVNLRAFLERPESFRNQAFRAVPGLEAERAEEEAPGGWRRTLRLRPHALAGSFGALESLARGIRSGKLSMAPTLRRVTVHSRVDRGLLREADRDSLWRVFELPVFEQLRGWDGELLAWECEAHTGLHLEAEHAVVEAPGNGGGGELLLTSLAGLRYPMLRMLTGLIGRYTEGLCECGETSGRVVLSSCVRKPPAVERASFDFVSQGALAR